MTARVIRMAAAILGAPLLGGSEEPWSYVPSARDAAEVGALVRPCPIGPENVRLVGAPAPAGDRADPRRTVVVPIPDEARPAAPADEVPPGALWPGADGRVAVPRAREAGGAGAVNPWIARGAPAAPRRQSFRCGGVVAGGTGAAFVDGKIVHRGDLLGGYRVAAIAAAGVVLDVNGAQCVLPAGRTTVLADAGG
jgi:hypothetical protein